MRCLHFLFVGSTLTHLTIGSNVLGGFSCQEMVELKEEAKQMFYHGWNNYMVHAFPEDELKPLSCSGEGSDPDPANINRNDVLGDYSVTLVDSLDMFAILDDQQNFEKYVGYVESYVSFNVSSTVQVFETTIRGLGGLLSAHLYASVSQLGHSIDGYDGQLLALAYDLGQRLLPAFNSPSGIPYARVNLRDGVVPIGKEIITETCTSGAGSLLLEFTLLSRLTGDGRFEEVAKRAFYRLWARRSNLDLVGMSIDSDSGQWQSAITGIGASVDSYYEYALKHYILFGERDFFKVFSSTYSSLKSYSFDGWSFDNINFQSGNVLTTWIDALGAFFPGLQVLHGDISTAINCHLAYYKLWNTFRSIPERWRKLNRLQSEELDPILLEWYPLRPEFIESTYYLYQATRDPLYIQVGKQVMKDLNKYNKVPCGYAGFQDIRTGQLSDRMESFFLSETVKYLYLLFDTNHELNTEYSNYVFSTEAHPLWYSVEVLEQASSNKFNMSLTNYQKFGSQQATTTKKQKQQGLTNVAANIFDKYFKSWGVGSSWNQGTSSYRNKKNESSISNPSRMSPHGFCQVWESPFGGHSSIASMGNFYFLDSILDYHSPQWLIEESQGLELTPMELENRFYDTYVLNTAVCKVSRENNILEMLFEIPRGEAKSHIQVLNQNNLVVEATNLNGVRMKLGLVSKAGGNKKSGIRDEFDFAYQVLLFNSIKIGDGTILVDEVGFMASDVIQVQDSSLFVQGNKVVNLAIGKST